MSKILIVDDEQSIREILTSILEDEGYQVKCAESAEDALQVLKSDEFSLIFLDLWLPKMGGTELLPIIKSELLPPEVIVISGHANVDIAVQVIKDGAFDCLEKPLDLNRTLTLTRNAINSFNLKKENIQLKTTSIMSSTLIGNSKEMQNIRKLVEQISDSDSRVMLLGENGTGKEVIAKEIYLNSKRRNKPFIEVNCAAIPENLIESELFGHEKGSFTGAIESRVGKFEAAHGGTLFLDEIADMSMSAQAKVLRAIQEQKFHRVGSEKAIDVDIRIISATNKDIQHEIKNGNFREDLYFRLSVIPINIPDLKDREGDIPLLAEYFMLQYNKAHSTNKRATNESYKYLESHDWPGNVRELKNFIERACIMSSSDDVNFNDFLDKKPENSSQSDLIENYSNLPLTKAKDEFEKKLIYSKLKQENGNITKAAAALGIYPSNLHNKIKKYGIEIKK